MNIRARLAKLEQQKAVLGNFSHLSNEALMTEIRDNDWALAEGLALKLGVSAAEVTMAHLLQD